MAANDATTPLLKAKKTVQKTTTYASTENRASGQDIVKTTVTEKTWMWKSDSYVWSLATLVLLLVVFTGLEFALLKLNLPAVSPEDQDALKFPKNLQDLKRLNDILTNYMDEHFVNVYVTYFITYIYLQSFSVPGSMWLSILGGTLFNFWLALLTICICTAIGATIAYVISGSLGSVAVMHLIGDRIAQWNEQLKQHKQHMLNYIIVLRIAPFPPNWVANLGAPHLHVPLSVFFWGTFIGIAPPSFIHVQAGAAVNRLSSSDQLQIFTPINVLCLVAVGIVALVPVVIRRRYKL